MTYFYFGSYYILNISVSMANIAEYLSQIQSLTQKNLEILQAINDSFFTKREHIAVSVGDTQYVVPSFIALENKINSLQENFSNLVLAPKTGEATFNFDGNSKTIEVKGYTCTPNHIDIDIANINGFSVEQNDIFKDFMTPNPYIKIDLQSLPNDITTVNVRKIAVKSDTLKTLAKTALGLDTVDSKSIVNYKWSDLNKILALYKEDIDYVKYDTIRQLPIRQNIGTGTYTIKSIDKDITDTNLDEYITVTVAEDLKYKLFDESISKYLTVGDYLVTYDDSAKMQITEINTTKKQITFRVLNGDYLNLVADSGDETYVSDLSKIKFFSPVDYDLDKYINIPLEEDPYVFIFVAPLNNRMNVQAPWGTGILVGTENLLLTTDNQTKFKTYYEENVRNVGDILYEVSSIMSNTIMGYSKDDFEKFTKYIPILDADNLQVVQINTHLNNSVTAQNIRSLYSQKQQYNNELNEVNEKINEINTTLSEIAFTDTTGVRSSYESQLSQLNQRKNELNTSITKITNEISTAANDSVIPLENAKYHIRGFYDWCVTDESKDAILAQFYKHVHGVKVQYRYKNVDNTTGTALSMQNGKFIFSDWNDMDSFILQKNPSYGDSYQFTYPQYNNTQDNGALNEPSFNQIDIPISQGETVDIRLKIIWDFGYPFIETTSAWSEILNVAFPDELLKDVQILDIVEENNNDIENNHFNNILFEQGVTTHIADKLVDQDVTFFHKPENISSGFYTDERRVIPLRDKLTEMDQSITAIQDLINGTNSENFSVYLIFDGKEHDLYADKENTFTLPSYSDTGCMEKSGDEKIYTMSATIQISNISSNTAYLYSMFPGLKTTSINDVKTSKYTTTDYYTTDGGGVNLGYPQISSTATSTSSSTAFKLQTCNQWLTFRVNNPYNGLKYYYSGSYDIWSLDNELQSMGSFQILKFSSIDSGSGKKPAMTIYPYLSDATALTITGDGVYSKMQLAPGESLQVPLIVQYYIPASQSIQKTMSFDIRSSLYSDPTNFTFTLQANNTDTVQEKTTKATNFRAIDRSSLLEKTKINTLQNITNTLGKSKYKKTTKATPTTATLR